MRTGTFARYKYAKEKKKNTWWSLPYQQPIRSTPLKIPGGDFHDSGSFAVYDALASRIQVRQRRRRAGRRVPNERRRMLGDQGARPRMAKVSPNLQGQAAMCADSAMMAD